MDFNEILTNDTIQKGLKNQIFTIDKTTKYIQYNIKNKPKYIITKPEEFLRARTLVEIVTYYKYDLKYIDFEVRISIASRQDFQADIIIFSDYEHKDPYVIYELKRENITPKEFEQAITQLFHYGYALNSKYVVVLNGIKQAYYEILPDQPRERETNIISHIPINFDDSSKNKPKYMKGENETKLTTEIELIQKFTTCYNTLWAGGKRASTEAIDELDKLVFCKYFDEKMPRKDGEAYDFQFYGTAEQTVKRVKDLYEEGRKKDTQIFREGIKLNNYELIEIVKILQDINFSITDLEAKSRAFEILMDNFFRGAFGQFFTPREVVKMIVNVLPINNTHKVLDTCCGSGGFLLYTLDKIRRIADNYYVNETAEHYKFWHEFAENKLFGIEINEQISRTAKMNMIMNGGVHTNIITYNGLKPIENICEDTGNTFFVKETFDFILTNPPFGSTIKSIELDKSDSFTFFHKKFHFFDERIKNNKSAIKVNEKSETLFIERAYQYLSENGVLAIILPDGFLTNSSLDYVREFIEEHFKYIAIVSLPGDVFFTTNAGVKSSILFLQKYSIDQTYKIMALKEELKEKSYNLQKINIDDAKKRKNKDALLRYKEIVDGEYKKFLKESIRDLFDYEILMLNAKAIGYGISENNTKETDIANIIQFELKNYFAGEKINISDKVFTRRWSDFHNRIDPFYYQEKFISYESYILNSGYEIYKLKDLIISLKTGATPSINTDPYTFEHVGIPFLRSTNLSQKGFSLENIKYIKYDFEKELTYSETDELIISIAGTVGLAIVNNYGKIAINQNLSSMQLRKDVNPHFLSYLINTKIYQELILRNTSNTSMKYLNNESLKDIIVPLPSLEEQNKVVLEYELKMNQADEMENEAQKLKIETKQKFENMILGVK